MPRAIAVGCTTWMALHKSQPPRIRAPWSGPRSSPVNELTSSAVGLSERPYLAAGGGILSSLRGITSRALRGYRRLKLDLTPEESSFRAGSREVPSSFLACIIDRVLCVLALTARRTTCERSLSRRPFHDEEDSCRSTSSNLPAWP